MPLKLPPGGQWLGIGWAHWKGEGMVPPPPSPPMHSWGGGDSGMGDGARGRPRIVLRHHRRSCAPDHPSQRMTSEVPHPRGRPGPTAPLKSPLPPPHAQSGGGGGWHKASVSECLPLAVPIGLSPRLILTLCGPKRVLIVSTEPPDDVSCWTTPGVGRPRDGAVARAIDQGHPDAHPAASR